MMEDANLLKLITQYIWLPLLAVIGYTYTSLQSVKKSLTNHQIDIAERVVTRTEMMEVFRELRESQREVAREIKSAHHDLAQEVRQLNNTLIQILKEKP